PSSGWSSSPTAPTSPTSSSRSSPRATRRKGSRSHSRSASCTRRRAGPRRARPREGSSLAARADPLADLGPPLETLLHLLLFSRLGGVVVDAPLQSGREQVLVGDPFLVVVRVLVPAAVAQPLHQAGRSVADVHRHRLHLAGADVG